MLEHRSASLRCGQGALEEAVLLSWALVFFVLAIVAGYLGFVALAGVAAGIAKILFLLFLIVLVVGFAARAFRGKSVL